MSRKVLPFLLTLFIVALDQLTKMWIVLKVPLGTIYHSFLNDIIWIVHVRNSAIGFSIGRNLPVQVKHVLFIILPLILLALLVIYVLRSKEISSLQRWAVCGILGGGIGNIIDRVFRDDWVVDFMSVKVFGLFGFDRWPTFNIADASVVICAILLMISLLFPQKSIEGDGK
ncbi:MAG: signal peptidase II [Spirochaetia bacterium]|nr:signal peptidase II [Spirochaetia bacterium]